MVQYQTPPSSLSLFSLAMVERDINDPIRILACKAAAREHISQDKIIVADYLSPIIGPITSETTLAPLLECDGPTYTPLVIDPLLPSIEIWVDVEIVEAGMTPLPNDLHRWIMDLQDSSPSPTKEGRKCRTTIKRRVCLSDLVNSIIHLCTENEVFDRHALFYQLFEDPIADMSEGLSGVLGRSVVQVDRIVQDFYKMDTYSKALLFLETFIAHLDHRNDISIRLRILDILVPEFCLIKRQTILRNKNQVKSKWVNQGLEADRDVTVISLERILCKFLYPATSCSSMLHHKQKQQERRQQLQSQQREREGHQKPAAIDEIVNCILYDKSVGRQTKANIESSAESVLGTAPGDLLVAIKNIPIRNRWRLLDCEIGNHYVLYPIFPNSLSCDNDSYLPVTFLSLKRETISRFFLPGLFGHTGQFQYGLCCNKGIDTSNNIQCPPRSIASGEQWLYALADYSPLRSPQCVNVSECCAPTSLKRPAVLPYYF
nr:MAG: wsv415-like protein [Penaeus monodon endogenous nimavirus]